MENSAAAGGGSSDGGDAEENECDEEKGSGENDDEEKKRQSYSSDVEKDTEGARISPELFWTIVEFTRNFSIKLLDVTGALYS